MKREFIRQSAESHSGMLHMGGAPVSRERSEPISSRMERALNGVPGLSCIWFPKTAKDGDVLELVQSYIRKSGFSDLDQAMLRLDLPGQRLMAVPTVTFTKSAGTKPQELLRNAIILARTAGLTYDPEIPPVFTQRRLERTLDFFTLSTNSFYELD